MYETRPGLPVMPGGSTLLLVVICTLAPTASFLITLGRGAVVYVAWHPQQVVASQFLLYLIAPGLIGNSLGYWAVNHWQELIDDVGPGAGREQ